MTPFGDIYLVTIVAKVIACCLTAPEPMLTYLQYDPVTFIWRQFQNIDLHNLPLEIAWMLLILTVIQISRGQWVSWCLNMYTAERPAPMEMKFLSHYSDVIMSLMASQITSFTIVYSTVYSGADQKISKLRVTGLCAGNSPVTGEFPAQSASNAENVSIWWRHHAFCISMVTLHVSRDTTLYLHLTSFVGTKQFQGPLSLIRINFNPNIDN